MRRALAAVSLAPASAALATVGVAARAHDEAERLREQARPPVRLPARRRRAACGGPLTSSRRRSASRRSGSGSPTARARSSDVGSAHPGFGTYGEGAINRGLRDIPSDAKPGKATLRSKQKCRLGQASGKDTVRIIDPKQPLPRIIAAAALDVLTNKKTMLGFIADRYAYVERRRRVGAGAWRMALGGRRRDAGVRAGSWHVLDRVARERPGGKRAARPLPLPPHSARAGRRRRGAGGRGLLHRRGARSQRLGWRARRLEHSSSSRAASR